MEKEITVKELAEKYNQYSNKAAKESFIKNTIKAETYVSYASKIAFAKTIVEDSSYKLDKDETGETKKTNYIKFNTPIRELFKIWVTLDLYTNLSLDSKNKIEEYDTLVKTGLLEEIMNMLPENDVKAFWSVINMEMDDFVNNNYETHTYISNQLNRILDVVKVIATPVIERIADIKDEEILDFLKIIAEQGVDMKDRFHVVK